MRTCSLRDVSLWLLILSGLLVAGSLTTRAQAEPGLACHYYGNRDFWYYAGSMTVPSLALDLNTNTLKWPPPNWDASKGPLFQRGDGWCLALHGALQVPQPGAYVFSAEGLFAELRLGGVSVPLEGTTAVALTAGAVPLRLYLKSDSRPTSPQAHFRLRWQGPGMTAPEDIPAAALSYTLEDQRRTKVFNPDIPLDQPQIRFFHRRDYTFNLPRDGFYEIAGHFPGVPRQIEMRLDGHFLYHHLGRTTFDPAGPSDYGFGFLNLARRVRYLTKGAHTLTISGYNGNYPFEDKAVVAFFSAASFGVSLVSPTDPAATFTTYAKDREDLVFRKGEPLTIRIEQATQAATAYTLEVVRQRGDGAVVWSSRAQLPANTPRAVAEIHYPCPEEGAFEYTLKDARGRVVDGPWAIAVVDPTPLPLPQASTPPAEPRRVLVDSVDCTQPEDREHLFRDNGTSKVVQGPAGAYRVTGTSPARRVWYKMKQPVPGLIPLQQQEPGAAHYQAMDWFAYTLRVEHPGLPHLVVAYIPNDTRRLVSVWGYDQVTGNYNAAALEAGNAPASPAFSPLTFVVWPNGIAVDVLTFCDAQERRAEDFLRQGAIQKLELYELPDGLPPLPEPVAGFASGKEFGWAGEQVNLGMEQRTMPSLWAGDDKMPGVVDSFQWCEGGYMDWKALATAWERCGQLSRWRGDHLLVWPVNSYSMGRMGEMEYMERDFESYTRSYRSRLVDPMRRDQLKLILLICQKYGVKFVADFQMSRWYDFVLLATDEDRQYTADGLFVTNLQGMNVSYPAQILNPAHPLARQYLLSWVREVAERYGEFPAFAGINLRQTGWFSNNSAFFFSRDYGYDDFTVELFEKETGLDVPVTASGPGRFLERRDYLLKNHLDPWLRWRCDKVTSLREEMLATLRRHAPHARLYGGAQEDLFDIRSGAGIAPELKGDRDLGYSHTVRVAGPHIENGSLDPVAFANFDVREPASLRRTLDTAMGSRGHEYGSNPCAGAGATIRPYPYELEPLATALAAGELQTVLYGGPWILPALDEGLRRWAQAWQAIPDGLPYELVSGPDEPIACWSARRGQDLVFYLVNRTALPRDLALSLTGQPRGVTDLVSGRALDATYTTRLDPFMPAVFRAPGATAVATVEILNPGLPVPAAFLMDKFEVTNALYERFAPEHRKARTPHSPGDNFPVVGVTWQEAIRFCNWRSRRDGFQPCYNEATGSCDLTKNGWRLPTEAEWERAAGGDDHRRYPWGDQPPSEGQVFRCNLGGYEADRTVDPGLAKGDGYEFAAPVGSYAEKYAGPYGHCDLAGNVWEWCQPTPGQSPALRGGAWTSDSYGVRCATRLSAAPDTASPAIGFRCVRTAPGAATPVPAVPAPTAKPTTPWGRAGAEGRLVLAVRETAGADRDRELVVLTGRQLLDRLPGARVDTRSLQIVFAGNPLPTQVDEKDGTGGFVTTPNHVLDPDDEVCFQATVSGGEDAEYLLYFSSQAGDTPAADTDLSWAEETALTAAKPYHLLLKNNALEVGIAGVDKPEGERDQWKTWHPGTISYLRKGAQSFFSPYNPNSGFPGRVWPATPERPVLVCRGSVRLVAQVKFTPTDIAWHQTADWGRDGDLVNARRTYTYTLASASRAIGLEIVVDYDSAGAKPYRELWHYLNTSISPTGTNPGQVVYAPKDGQPQQTALSIFNDRLVDGKLPDHAALGGNREGWIAQLDPATRAGLAIFAVPWVNEMRASFFKGASFGNGNYGACFMVHYLLDEVPPHRLVRPFRLQVLEDEDLETVAKMNAAYLHPLAVNVEGVDRP